MKKENQNTWMGWLLAAVREMGVATGMAVVAMDGGVLMG